MIKFDIPTAIITAVSLPLALLAGRAVYRKIRVTGLAVVEYLLSKIRSEAFETRLAVKRYCRSELEKAASKYLPVPGANDALLTDNAFVPLRLDSPTQDTTVRQNEIWKGAATRVQIIGDPGSGKTSFIKRMFRDSCRRASRNDDAHLPIIIELKNFIPPSRKLTEKALDSWVISHLKERMNTAGGKNLCRAFEHAMEHQGLLIMLDGLDEVATESYEFVRDAILALSRRLENGNTKSRLILTMRSQFYQQVHLDFMESFPRVYHIQPFSPGDIYSFLTLWPFSVDVRATINRIFGELTDRPTLREMCTNPLVLAMYVASDQSGGGAGTPETRTAFYSKVVDELLIIRRRRQLERPLRNVLRTQRERLFGILAFENLTDESQPANVISWKRAVEVTKGIYGCTTDDAATETLMDACKDTGLMSEERRGETLRFIHLTFCEFFAAKQAIDGRDTGWTDLIEAQQAFARRSPRAVSRLVEVIPFAAGLISPVRHKDAIDDVHSFRNGQLLGRIFLETQGYDHPVWTEYFDEESEQLVTTPQEDWDEGWLKRLHLFTVVLTDEAEWRKAYNRHPSTPGLETVFARLVRDDRDRLLAVFGSYAMADPQAAFRLAQSLGIDLADEYPELVIQHLASPPVLSHILEQFAQKELSLDRAAILCEAAFLSKYVASVLDREEWTTLGASWRTVGSMPADSIDHANRWFLTPDLSSRLGLSLLTYLLSLVCSAKVGDVDRARYPRVSEVSAVPAPGSCLFSQFMWVSPMTVIPIFLLGAVLTAASFVLLGETTGLVLYILTILVSVLYVALWRYPQLRASAYNSLIYGLPDSPEPPSLRDRWSFTLRFFIDQPARSLARRASRNVIDCRRNLNRGLANGAE